MADDRKKINGEVMGAVSAITHIGITIAACIVVGVFAGRFLDRLFGTSPGLLIVFSLLGVIAAFRTILKTHIARPQEDTTVPAETDTSQPADHTDNEGEQ